MKNSGIFRRGGSKESPQSMFLYRYMKINVHLVKLPQFYYRKMLGLTLSVPNFRRHLSFAFFSFFFFFFFFYFNKLSFGKTFIYEVERLNVKQRR